METNVKIIVQKRIEWAKTYGSKLLDLSDLGLTEVPNEVFECTELEMLYLGNNAISELPDAIGNLINLKYLDLYSNRLTKLPKTIKNLTKLEKVESRYNHKGLYWRKSKSN